MLTYKNVCKILGLLHVCLLLFFAITATLPNHIEIFSFTTKYTAMLKGWYSSSWREPHPSALEVIFIMICAI